MKVDYRFCVGPVGSGLEETESWWTVFEHDEREVFVGPHPDEDTAIEVAVILIADAGGMREAFDGLCASAVDLPASSSAPSTVAPRPIAGSERADSEESDSSA